MTDTSHITGQLIVLDSAAAGLVSLRSVMMTIDVQSVMQEFVKGSDWVCPFSAFSETPGGASVNWSLMNRSNGASAPAPRSECYFSITFGKIIDLLHWIRLLLYYWRGLKREAFSSDMWERCGLWAFRWDRRCFPSFSVRCNVSMQRRIIIFNPNYVKWKLNVYIEYNICYKTLIREHQCTYVSY